MYYLKCEKENQPQKIRAPQKSLKELQDGHRLSSIHLLEKLMMNTEIISLRNYLIL
jgi:hypothetical protein